MFGISLGLYTIFYIFTLSLLVGVEHSPPMAHTWVGRKWEECRQVRGGRVVVVRIGSHPTQGVVELGELSRTSRKYTYIRCSCSQYLASGRVKMLVPT